MEGSHGGGESVVKTWKSCEGIVAVERLEREREAVLGVRFSEEGKAGG